MTPEQEQALAGGSAILAASGTFDSSADGPFKGKKVFAIWANGEDAVVTAAEVDGNDVLADYFPSTTLKAGGAVVRPIDGKAFNKLTLDATGSACIAFQEG